MCGTLMLRQTRITFTSRRKRNREEGQHDREAVVSVEGQEKKDGEGTEERLLQGRSLQREEKTVLFERMQEYIDSNYEMNDDISGDGGAWIKAGGIY